MKIVRQRMIGKCARVTVTRSWGGGAWGGVNCQRGDGQAVIINIHVLFVAFYREVGDYVLLDLSDV